MNGLLTRCASGAVVLGMGRSGTSATTRALAYAGFYVGRTTDLMPETPANPVGYYENLRALDLNERLLGRTGAWWFAQPSRESQRAIRGWGVPAIERYLARLADEARPAPLAVKDPRIGCLIDLWAAVVGTRLHPVLAVRHPLEIAVRHPLEIARSLAARDGIPEIVGPAGWEFHTTGLLAFLHGRPVTVAHYAEMVASPSATARAVEAVSRCLAPRLAAQGRPLGRRRGDRHLPAPQRGRRERDDRQPVASPGGALRLSPPATFRHERPRRTRLAPCFKPGGPGSRRTRDGPVPPGRAARAR